ncbi:MAG: helix-hairpin-helix domain-containing protein [Oscillospiraceae bacterium]|nr:helix-hairpin-helix domain-containing protein [Oscillospiraceae bacterium]
MNEEERISKNLLIFMFLGCLLLLILIAGFCVFYSPKTITPTFSENVSDSEIYTEIKTSSDKISENIDVFPIKINSATSEELQLIPNIGPSTAKLIIEYRNEYGTIVSFRELLSIDGIGEKTVEILKEYCIIN